MVDEKTLNRAGVRVEVQMKGVAVGKTPGGVVQAVGIRTRSEWCRHIINRKELVRVLGRLVQATVEAEQLVEGDEV